MKTLKTSLVVLFITIASITRLDAQTPDFYPMDENFELLQKFYKADTVLVVFPDSEPISAIDKQAIETFMFWSISPFFYYKKESEINSMDLKKNIQFFGPIFKFQKEYSELPVRKTFNGFLYKTESFNKENDAFYYMNENANRLYTCKNSSKAINQFFIYGVGAYSFYIFSDYEIVYSGFFYDSLSKEKINDLNRYRELYFQQKTVSFFNLNIAKTLKVDSLFNIASNELDKYVINLCNYLEVDTSNIDKMNLYAYANRIDLQRFIAAPLWSTVWGKCVGNVLHSTQLNLSIVNHETAHSIIFQKIGDNTNSFWVEGFRQYTDYLFNKEAYNLDLEITKSKIELLNEELLTGYKFFINPENYCISGVFVKYIVDKIGFSQFKTVYSQQRIEEYITDKYKMSMDELIAEFKDQL